MRKKQLDNLTASQSFALIIGQMQLVVLQVQENNNK
jgi:hypothetical protein